MWLSVNWPFQTSRCTVLHSGTGWVVLGSYWCLVWVNQTIFYFISSPAKNYWYFCCPSAFVLGVKLSQTNPFPSQQCSSYTSIWVSLDFATWFWWLVGYAFKISHSPLAIPHVRWVQKGRSRCIKSWDSWWVWCY